MKQIKNVVGAVSGDTLVKVIIPSSPFLGQEAMVPVSAIGGGGESGEWSPTPTNIGGTNPIVTIIYGNYSRVGGVVTCSLFFEVEMDAAELTANFSLDLPIASDFVAAKNAFGIISYSELSNGEFASQGINADPATNKLILNVASTSNGFAFQSLTAMLQYVII
jgi:hypothetical protein